MKPARLLVEIEEELKQELKVTLIREGITLKTWLTRMAEMYVASAPIARAPARRAPPESTRRDPTVHPQAGRIHEPKKPDHEFFD